MITRGLANIAQGLESCLYMGNIDSLRDWGHAKDYVRMQWMMLQQDKPEDFVIATGVQYSVRQFITWSAAHLGIKLRFEGTGVDEVAIIDAIEGDNAPALKVGDIIVKIDPRHQFKRDFAHIDALAAELVAMANTVGGMLFVGVADDGLIAGLSANDIVRITWGRGAEDVAKHRCH